MKQTIKPITNLPVINFLTKEEFFISSLNTDLSYKELHQVVSICNQPLIYNILFKKKLKNKPYQDKDGKEFNKWAKDGWDKQTHFVFIIRDDKDNIVSCMDIKEASPSAEIGYWANKNQPGIVTNAVEKMVNIARKSGYESLFARILPANIKSQNLVKRVGFKYITRVKYKNILCHKYFLTL